MGHPILYEVKKGKPGFVVSPVPKCEGPGAPSFVEESWALRGGAHDFEGLSEVFAEG